MRTVGIFMLTLAAVFFTACDKGRVYEMNRDFEGRQWLIKDQPEFEFPIHDTTTSYNLYCDIRNEVSYPKANLYFTYYLQDSVRLLQKKLMSDLLFDEKTGAPYGTSGLGDIFDHQVPILHGYKFPHKGTYKIRFEQFMRMDTLPGVLAVGVRVEKSSDK